MPELKGHGEMGDITEFYPTVPALAQLITDRISKDFRIEPKVVLEPGCGAGSFMAAARNRWPTASIRGVEIDAMVAEHARRQDFLVTVDNLLGRHWGVADLIIGNPPFTLSEDFIHHLRDHLAEDGLLVFLLRLNFLATQERFETLFSRYQPAKVYPLVARPGFTSDGSTDGTDYGIMVWRKDTSPTSMDWIDNRATESRWSLGVRAVKEKGTKKILKPSIPDPRFPAVPRNRSTHVITEEPILEWIA